MTTTATKAVAPLTPTRSSRGPYRPVEMQRTDGQEVGDAVDWLPEFVHAIAETMGPGAQVLPRDPVWHIGSYAFPKERVLTEILDHIGIRWHLFRYQFHRRRKKPTLRSYFPGYIFLNFDARRDRWQQIHRIPGITGIFGRPDDPAQIPDDVMEDLLRRLPSDPRRNNTSETSIPAGTLVRVLRGIFEGKVLAVESSTRKTARVVTVLFGGRPIFADLHLSDVRVAEDGEA